MACSQASPSSSQSADWCRVPQSGMARLPSTVPSGCRQHGRMRTQPSSRGWIHGPGGSWLSPKTAEIIAGCAYSVRVARASAHRALPPTSASSVSAIRATRSLTLAMRSSSGSRPPSVVAFRSRSPARTAARPPTSATARSTARGVSSGAQLSSNFLTVGAVSRHSLADLRTHPLRTRAKGWSSPSARRVRRPQARAGDGGPAWRAWDCWPRCGRPRAQGLRQRPGSNGGRERVVQTAAASRTRVLAARSSA